MENFTFKAHRRAFLFALVIASMYAFGYAVKGVVWFFFFHHNEFFRKLNKSVLDCRKVERTSEASFPFQYICFIRGRNCLFPKIRPTILAMVLAQYSKNLEVWKADHSLALRFRIPLRPDQSRHTTERTNKQSLNSELMNIPKFLDLSSQC